jgi:hypothetical protein
LKGIHQTVTYLDGRIEELFAKLVELNAGNLTVYSTNQNLFDYFSPHKIANSIHGANNIGSWEPFLEKYWNT